MFPPLRQDASNPRELFQIWMNLPREGKLVEPHFWIFWRDDIPVLRAKGVGVMVIAGPESARRTSSGGLR